MHTTKKKSVEKNISARLHKSPTRRGVFSVDVLLVCFVDAKNAFTQEPYRSAKEPYISAKEPYISVDVLLVCFVDAKNAFTQEPYM